MPSNNTSVWLDGKEYKWSDKLGDYVYWVPIGGGRVAPELWKDRVKKQQEQNAAKQTTEETTSSASDVPKAAPEIPLIKPTQETTDIGKERTPEELKREDAFAEAAKKTALVNIDVSKALKFERVSENELPEFTKGTPKQISWARSIRKNALNAYPSDEVVEKWTATFGKNPVMRDIFFGIERRNIAKLTDAKVWIDNRDDTDSLLYANPIKTTLELFEAATTPEQIEKLSEEYERKLSKVFTDDARASGNTLFPLARVMIGNRRRKYGVKELLERTIKGVDAQLAITKKAEGNVDAIANLVRLKAACQKLLPYADEPSKRVDVDGTIWSAPWSRPELETVEKQARDLCEPKDGRAFYEKVAKEDALRAPTGKPRKIERTQEKPQDPFMKLLRRPSHNEQKEKGRSAWIADGWIYGAIEKKKRQEVEEATKTALRSDRITQDAEAFSPDKLPELEGSKKQIDWAKEIRAEGIEELLSNRPASDNPNYNAYRNEINDIQDAFGAEVDADKILRAALRRLVDKQTGARFWIDNRDTVKTGAFPGSIVGFIVEEFGQTKSPQEQKTERNALEKNLRFNGMTDAAFEQNSTLFPLSRAVALFYGLRPDPVDEAEIMIAAAKRQAEIYAPDSQPAKEARALLPKFEAALEERKKGSSRIDDVYKYVAENTKQALRDVAREDYLRPIGTTGTVEPLEKHNPALSKSEPEPLSSDPAEDAAMQIGNEVEAKFPTEEERLRQFAEGGKEADEWTSDLGQATDESESSALDEESANRLRRDDQTRRQFAEDARQADEWTSDLGQATDEELDSSALDKDAARKLRRADQGRRRRRLAKEAKAQEQEQEPTSDDAVNDNKEKRPSMWLNGREYKWSDKYGDYIFWLVLGGGKVVPKFYSQDAKQQAEWDKATAEQEKNGERQKPVAQRPLSERLPEPESWDDMLKRIGEQDDATQEPLQTTEPLSDDPAEDAAMQIGNEAEVIRPTIVSYPFEEEKGKKRRKRSKGATDQEPTFLDESTKEETPTNNNPAEAASMQIGNETEDRAQEPETPENDEYGDIESSLKTRSKNGEFKFGNERLPLEKYYTRFPDDAYRIDEIVKELRNKRPDFSNLETKKTRVSAREFPKLTGKKNEARLRASAQETRSLFVSKLLKIWRDTNTSLENEAVEKLQRFFGDNEDFNAFLVQSATLADFIKKKNKIADWAPKENQTTDEAAEERVKDYLYRIPEHAIETFKTRDDASIAETSEQGQEQTQVSSSLSSDPAEDAAMQIGNEIEAKFPTEEERQAEEERLRQFAEGGKEADEWTSDLGQETDESESSALDDESANRLRRDDQTRRQFAEDARQADEWTSDLGQETDEELDSSALDKDAARKLRRADQGRRRRRLAKEAKAQAQETQEPAPTSDDKAEAAAMQIGAEVEQRTEPKTTAQPTQEPTRQPTKTRARKSTANGETLRGGRPKAWIADKTTPSNFDRSVVHNVKNNMYMGWSDVLNRVADALESGDEQEAARLMAKARNNALNIYRRAYSVHGDGAALEILTGFNHGASPEVSIRLALDKKLAEWTKGNDVAAIRARAARMRAQYAAPSPSKSGVKALSGAEGTDLEKGSGISARRLEPGVTPGRPKTPDFNERYAVKVGDLNLDPKRFQFKLNVNESGVTSELSDATYNPDFAGEILVWRDPADGKDYVVNGHHRFNLAKRSGWNGNVFVRYSRAKDADEAKIDGAVVNIADAKGTATDAADVIRHSPNAEDVFLKKGVSPSRAQFARGRVLARLDDGIFNDLKRGILTEQQAAIIGDVFPVKNADGTYDAQQEKQRAFYMSFLKPRLNEYAQADKKKSLTLSEIEDKALAFASARGVEDSSRQAGLGALFDMGVDFTAEVEAKAALIGAVKNALATNKGVLGKLSRQSNVDAMRSEGVLAGDVDVGLAKQKKDAVTRAVEQFKEDLKGVRINNVLQPFVEQITRLKGKERSESKADVDRERRQIEQEAIRAISDYYGDPAGLFASAKS